MAEPLTAPPTTIHQKGAHDDARGSDVADAAKALCKHRHRTVAPDGFCGECWHFTTTVVEELELLGWTDTERSL
jgi:hypothetical protein